MGDGETSAITNPMHVTSSKPVLGADVIAGHDRMRAPMELGASRRGSARQGAGKRHCATGEAAAGPTRRRPSPAPGLRFATHDGSRTTRRIHASGKRGNFPVGTPLTAAARRSGRRNIDSVLRPAGCEDRCQYWSRRAEFAKHGVYSSSARLSPFSEPESATPGGCHGGRTAPVMSARVAVRCGHRRARDQQVHRKSGAQGADAQQ